jgi:hypothetical protein
MNRSRQLLRLVWDRMHEQEVAGHFPLALLLLVGDDIRKEDEDVFDEDEPRSTGTLPPHTP